MRARPHVLEQVREILADEGLRQETVRLSAQTRWDSIYLMLESVLTAKQALQTLQRSQQLPLDPNLADGDVVNEIEQLKVCGCVYLRMSCVCSSCVLQNVNACCNIFLT